MTRFYVNTAPIQALYFEHGGFLNRWRLRSGSFKVSRRLTSNKFCVEVEDGVGKPAKMKDVIDCDEHHLLSRASAALSDPGLVAFVLRPLYLSPPGFVDWDAFSGFSHVRRITLPEYGGEALRTEWVKETLEIGLKLVAFLERVHSAGFALGSLTQDLYYGA